MRNKIFTFRANEKCLKRHVLKPSYCIQTTVVKLSRLKTADSWKSIDTRSDTDFLGPPSQKSKSILAISTIHISLSIRYVTERCLKVEYPSLRLRLFMSVFKMLLAFWNHCYNYKQQFINTRIHTGKSKFRVDLVTFAETNSCK